MGMFNQQWYNHRPWLPWLVQVRKVARYEKEYSKNRSQARKIRAQISHLTCQAMLFK